MPDSALYVYAIGRDLAPPEAESIRGERDFAVVGSEGLHALVTIVPRGEFSQEAVDAHAGDLEWLGGIGYRHQAVLAALTERTTVIPLRAFTLFSSEQRLAAYLREQAGALNTLLHQLENKREWTLRFEFDASRWSEALLHRVHELKQVSARMREATPGKAFLLRKKLDEERKKASRTAEQDLLAEVEKLLQERLRCPLIAETREQRNGAFPQINLLVGRGEEGRLIELHRELAGRCAPEGVTLSLTGPWPPYTFASVEPHG